MPVGHISQGWFMYQLKMTKDENLVKSLHSDIFPHDEWYESENSLYWVIYKNKRPVGFCMMSATQGDYVFYSRAGIIKSERGKGLQRKLIKVRERKARKLGYKKAITYTKIYNITSNRNLQKEGYFLYIPEYQYADSDCLYWIKELK